MTSHSVSKTEEKSKSHQEDLPANSFRPGKALLLGLGILALSRDTDTVGEFKNTLSGDRYLPKNLIIVPEYQ